MHLQRSACLLALLVACSGCGTTYESTSPSTSPSTSSSTSASPTSTAPPTLVPATDITAAGGVALPVKDADWVQVVGGHVWTTLGTEVAQQLDPTTGAALKRVALGGQVCTAMDQGFDSLWLGVCGDPAQVVRLDPATGKVLARVEIPADLEIVDEGSVASGEGFVWVVTAGDERTLVKIDPASNTVVDRITVEVGVAAARAGEGALWLTNPEDGTLTRRNLETGAVEATIRTGAGARFFAIGEGAVWVQNNDDGTVTRVDPAQNRAVATIAVDTAAVDGGDLAVGGGFVWARVTDTLVAKIDPTTNAVVARYAPPAGSGSVAADADAVWISAHDENLVYRLPLP